MVCTILPKALQSECDSFVLFLPSCSLAFLQLIFFSLPFQINAHAEKIIDGLIKRYGPDAICKDIGSRRLCLVIISCLIFFFSVGLCPKTAPQVKAVPRVGSIEVSFIRVLNLPVSYIILH